jgi:hypothetical protein
MFIIILKFIHVIIALSLVGLTLYCFKAAGSKRFSRRPPTILAGLALLALFTGTFLIYPRHFTFHTPWVQAAFILSFVFMTSAWLLMRLKQTLLRSNSLRIIYFFLILILFAITHDAVTKTTFLF